MIAILAYFNPEEATRGVLQEKMFLEISQNSQENTCEFCETSRNTFFTEHLRTLLNEVLNFVRF